MDRTARATDPAIAAAVAEAHRAYATERGESLARAEGWGGVGGTRRGIKCLHAHYAYHLAGGDDVVGRWTAERVEPVHPWEPGGRVAAIDQGTNSTRLLVLEPRGGDEDPLELARDMRITRLGKDVDRTGRLDPETIERTLAVVARFARRARALHAERIRLGATSAVRDASNREEFLDPVRDLIDGEPEVIDGEREAALSFLGGTRGLDPAFGPFLLIDIGGGSTEFVFGSEPAIMERAISTQMGSVRLTERVPPSDPPSEADLRSVRAADRAPTSRTSSARCPLGMRARSSPWRAPRPPSRRVRSGIERYDPDLIHRSTLTLADAERTLRELATMTNEERAAIPVMPKGRAEVIVAGATILVNAMRRFGFEEALVSETDILDGLALELLDVR